MSYPKLNMSVSRIVGLFNACLGIVVFVAFIYDTKGHFYSVNYWGVIFTVLASALIVTGLALPSHRRWAHWGLILVHLFFLALVVYGVWYEFRHPYDHSRVFLLYSVLGLTVVLNLCLLSCQHVVTETTPQEKTNAG